MKVADLIPSWLTSWVAWRNVFTDPGHEPFNILKKEFGLDRLPTESEFLIHHNGECPYCHDDSIVKNERLGIVFCICKVLQHVQKLEVRYADIRSIVDDAKLDDLKTPREMGGDYIRTLNAAKKEIESFIKSPDFWIYIYSFYGMGKTMLLKVINAAFKPMSLYISARDLEQLTHKLRKEDELDYFYDVLINAPILILDDMGMEYGGPLVKSVFEKVIDARYEKWPEYPTIVASNLRPEEFSGAGAFGRAADRILDKGRTHIVQILAMKSYRSIAVEMRP